MSLKDDLKEYYTVQELAALVKVTEATVEKFDALKGLRPPEFPLFILRNVAGPPNRNRPLWRDSKLRGPIQLGENKRACLGQALGSFCKPFDRNSKAIAFKNQAPEGGFFGGGEIEFRLATHGAFSIGKRHPPAITQRERIAPR